MTQKDFYVEKFHESYNKYIQNYKEYYTNPSIAQMEPFKIADGLYYVGDKKVCMHLIDTGNGLILLDSGFPCAIHLLVDSIWRAGFDPKNVRWIIHTHGHYDHFGASEEFRRMYHTKLAISKIDAKSLRKKPQRALIDNESFPYVKIPDFDHEIEDGEVFELGKIKIRCVLTPGHCEGVLSLFFQVTDNGNTYLAGMFGGAGTGALTLPYIYYNEDSDNPPLQMLQSIEKIWNEPVDIHLGNHPYNNHTLEKREKQMSEGGNPFIDPNSWHDFLRDLRQKIATVMENNKKLEQEWKEKEFDA